MISLVRPYLKYNKVLFSLLSLVHQGHRQLFIRQSRCRIITTHSWPKESHGGKAECTGCFWRNISAGPAWSPFHLFLSYSDIGKYCGNCGILIDMLHIARNIHYIGGTSHHIAGNICGNKREPKWVKGVFEGNHDDCIPRLKTWPKLCG